METTLQSVSATLDSSVATIKPVAITVAQKTSLIAGNVFDSIINWVSLHPKTALVLTIFILGFICGLLF